VSIAPFERRRLEVAGIDELGAYRLLRVRDPDGPEPRAGQFAMLAAVERWGGGEDERPYLPRAFSIARWAADEAHFLLEDVGPGSRRLCELGVGEGLWALGPLGRPFSLPSADAGRALLVGGGAGIAPLAILQDQIAEALPAVPMSVLLGFRDGERAVGSSLLRNARVVTDDGSVGARGLVTDVLREELGQAPGTVYACGPAPMLEAVRALCAEHAVAAELALEAPMACGFGACYGCAVARRGGGYLRVCVDGPVIGASLFEHVDAHAGAPA
jgi:NAD(P)H-flavin reductase